MHHAHTKNVQIRGVPDKTHAVFRRRAAEAGTSMQEYLLSILNDLVINGLAGDDERET
jgi:hypothetical protein